MGGILNTVTQALTPQNNFGASSPINLQAANQAMMGSQQNFINNQANQNQLAQTLLSQSQGQGPNPAQQLFNQNTQNAIKQNAGMISSQKGINPALAARLGAQNAASMSQQGAGQAATMNAEQQLGAQNSLSNLYGTIGNQSNQNVATQGGLANQAGLGAQGLNAGVAAQNAAANQNTAGGLLNGAGSAAMAFLNKGGMVQNFDDGGSVTNPITGMTGPGTIDPNAFNFVGSNGQQWGFTQPTQSAGVLAPEQSLASTPTFATSAPDQLPGLGPVSSQSVGDISNGSSSKKQPMQMFGPNNASQDIANKILSAGGVNLMPAGNASVKNGFGPAASQSNQGTQQGVSQLLPYLASAAMSKGGKVPPAHLMPIHQIYHGGFDNQKTAQLKAQGGKVPGKAKVPGDSPANDTVKTLLSPGELVLPRSVMNSKDPVKSAAQFVAEKLQEHKQDDKTNFHAALKRAMGARK